MGKVNFRRYLLFLPEMLLLLGAAICFFGDLIGASSVNYFMIACIALL
jgi:hypothetical protein